MFHVVPPEWSKGMGGAVGEPSASGARSFVFKPRAASGGSEYACMGPRALPSDGARCIRLYIYVAADACEGATATGRGPFVEPSVCLSSRQIILVELISRSQSFSG